MHLRHWLVTVLRLPGKRIITLHYWLVTSDFIP